MHAEVEQGTQGHHRERTSLRRRGSGVADQLGLKEEDEEEEDHAKIRQQEGNVSIYIF